MRRSHVAIVAALVVGGCATTPPLPLPIVASPDGKTVQVVSLKAWLIDHPLQVNQHIRVDELGRSQFASIHLVQIRSHEQPHVHHRHDGVAIVEQGHGTLFLGSHRLRLKPGSVVNIPRGVPHAFVNESSKPAVAFVVFSPPFDGTDSLPVAEGH